MENTKNGKIIPITHGELCLTPVDMVPKGTPVVTKQYVAAHSESGHNHMLESKTAFEVYEGEERYVVIKDLAKLWHKKTFDIHETRTLVPGVYKITEKTEYSPFSKLVTRVFD